MKRLFLCSLVLCSLAIISCSKNESGGGIKLSFSAIHSNASKMATSQKALNSNVVFTEFKISIRDVVFKNDDDPTSDLATDEIQFRGPYQIDLLKDENALSQTIGDAFVPDGLYKEMRFKFHKDEDLPATDKLFDKSIYVEGTINDIPFVFWHDTSENLDVGRDTGVLVENGTVNFTVQFDISQFLNSLNQIDLSLATDSNDDGLIEIYPNDEDGNQDIADALKDNIKMAADLLE